MPHFHYQNGKMYTENVPISDIAKTIATPFYCYSTQSIQDNYRAYSSAFSDTDALICYAVKANSNQAILQTLALEGAGADVVSEGEIRRALRAGIPASKIVYSGVAKTTAEIRFALELGIYQFNVESVAELHEINKEAVSLETTAYIAFRVNPDVDAKTHEKISTGKAENKFGIPWQKAREVYLLAASLPGIKVQGIDVHIGSQLVDLAPYENALDRILTLRAELIEDGHEISVVDIGGGLGIKYDENDDPPAVNDYATMVKEKLAELDCKIILEPGRSIVGNAGVLVSEVIYVKHGDNRKFLIIDAAMNDLARPSMYDAFHQILPVNESDMGTRYDIVGPICETGDTFAKGRLLPEMASGDLVVIKSAGAYGAVMSSTYNTRLLVPEVLVKADLFSVVRKRPTYDEQINMDTCPQWLT